MVAVGRHGIVITVDATTAGDLPDKLKEVVNRAPGRLKAAADKLADKVEKAGSKADDEMDEPSEAGAERSESRSVSGAGGGAGICSAKGAGRCDPVPDQPRARLRQ